MKAETYEQLFNFEDTFEEALAGVLAESAVPAFTQRSEGEITSPRFEPSFRVGEATGHVKRLSDGTFAAPDTFRAQIVIRIITARGENPESHAPYRAKIRQILYQHARYFNVNNLPFHHLIEGTVLESGATHAISTDEDEDISEITFNCQFGIRFDAWPEP